MKISIIGGGVVGVINAYFLAKNGFEVSLFERSKNVAQEASFGTFDLIGPASLNLELSNKSLKKLLPMLLKVDSSIFLNSYFDINSLIWILRMLKYSSSLSFLNDLSEFHKLASYSKKLSDEIDLKNDLSYQQKKGLLIIFRSIKDYENIYSIMEYLSKYNFDHRLINKKELITMEPSLRYNDNIHAAIFVPEDTIGNCPLYVRQIKELCLNLGVKFFFDNEVYSITPNLENIIIKLKKNIFKTDKVVITAGSESIKLLKNIGINIPNYPIKIYSASSMIQNFDHAPQFSIYDFKNNLSVTRLDKRIKISGFREFGSNNLNINPKVKNKIIFEAQSFFPRCCNYSSANFWSSSINFLPSINPIVSKTKYPNLFVNFGHGINAWSLACGSAKLILDMILKKKTELSVENFSINRFKKPI